LLCIIVLGANVRGMAWVTAGHFQHHADILRDRYGMSGLP
jgi:hypothetical protein